MHVLPRFNWKTALNYGQHQTLDVVIRWTMVGLFEMWLSNNAPI